MQYYKLAKPDGWDFHTGKTINYRENIGKVVKCPKKSEEYQLCSSTVIHACLNPLDCFIGAKIPCSAYQVEGNSVVDDGLKFGFKELLIVAEITDLDNLFGWKYSELMNPLNPLIVKVKLTKVDEANLKDWASVWASVRASVRDSVWAYIGSLFPNIKKWKYIKKEFETYPFQSCVDLWSRGFLPSFNGKVWRIHQGKNAKVILEISKEELRK